MMEKQGVTPKDVKPDSERIAEDVMDRLTSATPAPSARSVVCGKCSDKLAHEASTCKGANPFCATHKHYKSECGCK
jgi:hypothetical protein